MTKSTIVSSINTKVAQLENEIKELDRKVKLPKDQGGISPATRNTQKQIRNVQIKYVKGMLAIASLLSDKVKEYKFDTKMEALFDAAVDTGKRQITTIDIQLGDNVLVYLQGHTNVTFDRIKKYLDDKGWKLGASGVVEA